MLFSYESFYFDKHWQSLRVNKMFYKPAIFQRGFLIDHTVANWSRCTVAVWCWRFFFHDRNHRTTAARYPSVMTRPRLAKIFFSLASREPVEINNEKCFTFSHLHNVSKGSNTCSSSSQCDHHPHD